MRGGVIFYVLAHVFSVACRGGAKGAPAPGIQPGGIRKAINNFN